VNSTRIESLVEILFVFLVINLDEYGMEFGFMGTDMAWVACLCM